MEGPQEVVTHFLLIFISVLIVSILIYLTVFGFVSYNSYIKGYALQNWCSEDYTEFESIRYQYLGEFPDIAKPLFLTEYIIFIVVSLYIGYTFLGRFWPAYNDITMLRGMPLYMAPLVLLSIIGLMIGNQVKPVYDYDKIIKSLPSVGFGLAYLVTIGFLFINSPTMSDRSLQYKISEVITYMVYVFIILKLMFEAVSTPSKDFEGIIKHSWIVSLLLTQTMLMGIYNNFNEIPGFNTFDEETLKRCVEFYGMYLAGYLGTVKVNEKMIGGKQKSYKKDLMRLNITISKVLANDNQMLPVDQALAKNEMTNLYAKNNTDFITLFAYNTDLNAIKYVGYINPILSAQKKSMIDQFMFVFQSKLLDIINGSPVGANTGKITTDEQKSKQFIDDLKTYDAVNSNNPNNQITVLREQFNEYLMNPTNINTLISDNNKYSIQAQQNILHKLIINEYNQMNPSNKDTHFNRLDSFLVSDGKNIYNFYYVGPVDVAQVYANSDKIRELNNNNKNTFTDEEDMLNELYNVMDSIHLPCVYLSYYNGDIEKFLLRLKNERLNLAVISDDLKNEITKSYAHLNDYGTVDNDWGMTIFSFLVFIMVIYILMIQFQRYSSMSSMIVAIVSIIFIFVLSYSIKLIVNNE